MYCVVFPGSMAAIQGGSITKGIPGTRVHPEPPISYRGGSITQVRTRWVRAWVKECVREWMSAWVSARMSLCVYLWQFMIVHLLCGCVFVSVRCTLKSSVNSEGLICFSFTSHYDSKVSPTRQVVHWQKWLQFITTILMSAGFSGCNQPALMWRINVQVQFSRRCFCKKLKTKKTWVAQTACLRRT